MFGPFTFTNYKRLGLCVIRLEKLDLIIQRFLNIAADSPERGHTNKSINRSLTKVAAARYQIINARRQLGETVKKMKSLSIRDGESGIGDSLISITKLLDEAWAHTVDIVKDAKHSLGDGDEETVSALDGVLHNLRVVNDARNDPVYQNSLHWAFHQMLHVIETLEPFIQTMNSLILTIELLFTVSVVMIFCRALNGIATGSKLSIAGSLVLVLIYFIFGLDMSYLNPAMMTYFISTFGTKSLATEALDSILAYFVLDEPHPKGPLEALEEFLGNIVFLIGYTASFTFVLTISLALRDRPSMLLHDLLHGLLHSFLSMCRFFLYFAIYLVLFFVLLYAYFRWRSSIKPNRFIRSLGPVLWLHWQPIRIFILVLKDIFQCFIIGFQAIERHFRRPVTHQYTYTKLDIKSKQIRLLKIYKATPFSEPTCQLIAVPLAKAPPYDAISYTWNDQTADRILQLISGKLLTTRNVMRIIRKRASCIETRWLWLDAVSINQDDEPEKNAQVSIMGEIYRSASRTIAWLDYYDIPIIDLMLIHILNRSLRNRHILLETTPFSQPGILGAILRRMWIAQARFLNQTYWSRGWIIQELVLAKKICIVYGGQFLLWETLERYVSPPIELPMIQAYDWAKCTYQLLAFETLQQTGHDKLQPGEITHYTMPNIHQLMMIKFLLQNEGPLTLGVLLEVTSEFQTGNPLDKIYSLLGVANLQGIEIAPDYTASVEKVFLDTAASLLASNPDIVLQRTGHGYRKSIHNLPSWVPDWTTASPHTHGSLGLGFSEIQLGFGENYHSGFSTKWSKEQHKIAIRGRALEFKGLPITYIAHMSETFLVLQPKEDYNLEYLLHNKRNLQFYQTAEGLLEYLPAQYLNSSEASAEALWRTLVGDVWQVNSRPRLQSEIKMRGCLPTKFPAPTAGGDKYRQFKSVSKKLFPHSNLTEHSSITTFSEVNGSNSQTKYGSMDIQPTELEAFYQFLFNSTCAVVGKRIALTFDGHLCLVPHLTEKGDQVVVVRGIRQPLLLRQNTAATWTLVGSCYVHGVMMGEVWKTGRDVVEDSFCVL